MKYGLNYIAEKFVSSDTLKLYELVSEMKLHIPHHQRDYSWDEEQVNQFLTDIKGNLYGFLFLRPSP